MGYSFDGPTKKITMTSGTTSADIDDMYSRWYDWWVTSDNSKYDLAMRNVGGDEVSATKDLGITFFLTNGWRIVPDSADHRLELSGNLYTDPAGYSPVDTVTGYSIIVEYSVSNLVDSTLAQMPEIEYASFNGGVTLDPVGGTAGTAFPFGTPQQPVDNLADAMTIAVARGLTTIFVTSDMTVDDGGDYRNMTFIGESMSRTTLTIDADAQVDNCEFYECSVTGTLDGDCKLKNCKLLDLNYISGYVELCLLAGDIQLGGGAEAYFLDCWAGTNLGTPPSIDLGGSGQTLVMQNFNGYIQWHNKTGSEQANASLNAGWVVLDSTITAGTVNILGVGTVEDNTTGTATVNTQHLIDGQLLQDLHLLQGLNAANPLTVTPTSRVAGSISQTISGDGETTSTVTRT